MGNRIKKNGDGLGKDVLVTGLALFAMFFGAGNLIFPPDIGVRCGESWWIAYLFYFLADAGFGIFTVLALVNFEGSLSDATGVIGKVPSILINTACILCIGPCVAIPRTAATTFEIGIVPIFGISNNSRLALGIFSIAFFGIVLLLTLKPSKIVDIVGQVLTPILVIALGVIIAVGVVSPKAGIAAASTGNAVKSGILNGYQTMDLLAAMLFSVLIVSSLNSKGHKETKVKRNIALKASLIAGVLLFFVYGGLAYLGATTGNLWKSAVFDGSVNQAMLVINITQVLLGKAGVILLGVVVACACLTTAIGLTSAAGSYFSELSNGKISYKSALIATAVLSAGLCNVGLSGIIAIASPVLSVIYPLAVVLVFTSFLRNKVTKVLPYRISSAVTFFISFVTVLFDTTGVQSLAWIHSLPLDGYGFNWFVPALVTFVIGMFLPSAEIQKAGIKEPVASVAMDVDVVE